MTDQFQYPYDPVGELESNYISDEPHTLNPSQGKGHALIVPKAGPFYRKDFALVHTESGRKLRENVDYVFTHMVLDISHALKQHVYLSVTVTNKDVMGNVVPTYRTIGGQHVLDEEKFANYAIHLLDADGAYKYSDLTDIPEEFEPEDHDLPIEMTKGYDDLVHAVKGISFGNRHSHSIHHVQHLDTILKNKVDMSGAHKVLTDVYQTVDLSHIGAIAVRLPKCRKPSLYRAKIQISTLDGVRYLQVSGMVKAYHDGTTGESWFQPSVEPSYSCYEGDFFPSYDSEHYPCIYLGKDVNWKDTSVALVEFYSANPETVEGESIPFRVSLSSTTFGLDYLNTNELGVVLNKGNTQDKVEGAISSKYYGVLPQGVYRGYTFTVSGNTSQVIVGDTGTLSSAVIYHSGAATSCLLEFVYKSLDVPGPGDYDIVLGITQNVTLIDPQITVDSIEFGAYVAILPIGTKDSTMIKLGEIHWPDNGLPLDGSHVTMQNRQNAVFDSGVFNPTPEV